jgi:hypothetical protein
MSVETFVSWKIVGYIFVVQKVGYMYYTFDSKGWKVCQGRKGS